MSKHCLEPGMQPPAVPPVKVQLSNSTCLKKSWDAVKSSREVWPCAGWPKSAHGHTSERSTGGKNNKEAILEKLFYIVMNNKKTHNVKKRPRLNFSISIYCFVLWPYLVKVKKLTLGFKHRNCYVLIFPINVLLLLVVVVLLQTHV